MGRTFRTDWFTGETVVRYEGLRVTIDGKPCVANLERSRIRMKQAWREAVGRAVKWAIENAEIAGRTD